jgi:acyl-CoA thioesterase
MTSHHHAFDDAIALEAIEAGRYAGRTHAAWGNMVGPFGGITAATLLNAAWIDARRIGEPLSMTVNFAGPLSDGAFVIDAHPVRTNRTTQHWSLTMFQRDAITTTASAVFATRRDTWSAAELHPPDVPAADGVAITPSPIPFEWPRRYEMRFVRGPWPDLKLDEPLPESESLLWLRDDPARPLDALSLVAQCDVFYPRIFRRRQRFTPAGTVSMTTYFHAEAAAFAEQGSRPVLARARGQRFTHGFFDQSAEVWSDSGQLLASSHQVVYFKE